MKVILTGASGFIGTHFLKYSNNLDIVPIDLLVQKVSEIDFTGCECVLHLAALVHQMKGAPEEDYFKVNCDLTLELAQKAKFYGVKHFVFMSTSKVYGESTNKINAFDENSKCFPADPYGKSKHCAEQLLISLQDQSFKVAIIRSPVVYGAGVKANMFNLVKLVNKYPVLPLGGINNKRSFVYVGNLAALLYRIILIQSSGIFVAGDRNMLSTTQLIQLISEESQKKIYLFKIPGLILKIAQKIFPAIVDRLYGSFELNNGFTNTKLDFIPPYETRWGIRDMINWYNSTC